MLNIKDLFNMNYYTSEIDKFIIEFDQNHPRLSRSQRKEKEKYAEIFAKRDHAILREESLTIWDQF